MGCVHSSPVEGDVRGKGKLWGKAKQGVSDTDLAKPTDAHSALAVPPPPGLGADAVTLTVTPVDTADSDGSGASRGKGENGLLPAPPPSGVSAAAAAVAAAAAAAAQGRAAKPAKSPGAPVPKTPNSCIEMLAFEVASVVVRAINLRQSLLERDIEDLRQEVLASEGIRMLVSDDFHTVWAIAAEDKRGELRQVAKDVARLGLQCSPESPLQSLNQRFDGLGTPGGYMARLSSSEAEAELKVLEQQAQVTADLYHELTSLDNMQQALNRKLLDEPSSANKDLVVQMRAELKAQEKMVKMMKKQGLWSRRLDEVVDRLAEIVVFLHDQIVEIFGADVVQMGGLMSGGGTLKPLGAEIAMSRRLGATGMALQYANVINMIDALVMRPSVVEHKRDELFAALPASIRGRLKRTLLLSGDIEQESTDSIRQKMEGVLDWLVTMAENTVRYGLDLRMQGYTDLTLLQTLHHVEEQRMENLVLLLLVGLQHLVSRSEDGLDSQLWPPVPRMPVVASIPLVREPLEPGEMQALAEEAGVEVFAKMNGVEGDLIGRAGEVAELRIPGVLSEREAPGTELEPIAEVLREGDAQLAGDGALEASSSAQVEVRGAAAGVTGLGIPPAGPGVGKQKLERSNSDKMRLIKAGRPTRMSIDGSGPRAATISSANLWNSGGESGSVGEEWLKVMAKSQGFAKAKIDSIKAGKEDPALTANLPTAVQEALRGKARSQAFTKATAAEGIDNTPRSGHSKAMSRALLAALAEAEEVEGPRVRPMTPSNIVDVDRLKDFNLALSSPSGSAQERLLIRKPSGSFIS